MAGVRSRPCTICRKRFVPHPRVRDRQRTCAAPACKRALHARACKRWHRDNALLALEARLRERVIAPPVTSASTPSGDAVERIDLALLTRLHGPAFELALRLVLHHLVSVLRDEIRARPSRKPADSRADPQSQKRDEIRAKTPSVSAPPAQDAQSQKRDEIRADSSSIQADRERDNQSQKRDEIASSGHPP